MQNFFTGCSSLDEAKALYKKLVFQLHPDVSGYDSTEDFKRMQNEFEAFRPSAGNEKFKGEFEQWRPAEFMAVIEALQALEGLEIEICGSFIWVGGNTRQHKEAIKAIEPGDYFKLAQWHKIKALWFFAPATYRRFSGGELDMDEIRQKYGSESFRHKSATFETLQTA